MIKLEGSIQADQIATLAKDQSACSRLLRSRRIMMMMMMMMMMDESKKQTKEHIFIVWYSKADKGIPEILYDCKA